MQCFRFGQCQSTRKHKSRFQNLPGWIDTTVGHNGKRDTLSSATRSVDQHDNGIITLMNIINTNSKLRRTKNIIIFSFRSYFSLHPTDNIQ